ncbi:hypothetical protein [Aquimarina algicola]|uniref:Uncharacterized protein n=1 Tax=Aquimarina algicola TaxID=2589995 RepID=A0A504J133_9FLAO|nr:hypothetical protein [Aquimarina algicola]TPN82315.1 hypothetical protein FHK87_23105 [Aquimarina algicola]
MQRVITIICCLIHFFFFGQRDLKTSIEDFNNDGIVDTLTTFYEGGSMFGGRYAAITNGKTNETYKLNNDGCFCEIKDIITIPPKLAKQENKPFLDALKKQILPKQKEVADESLNWMIKSSYTNTKLSNNIYFDQIINPQTKWNTEAFESPKSYYLEIKGDTLYHLYKTIKENVTKDPKGFLVYYAHNHYRNEQQNGLQEIENNSRYTLYKTSHGVLAKKGQLHKWLFVTDIDLTGGPEKLRWDSIKKVALVEHYAIIQQNMAPSIIDQFFVINLETGICGKLKTKLYDSETIEDNNTDTFLIEDNSIQFISRREQFKYGLKDIFKAIDTLYENQN